MVTAAEQLEGLGVEALMGWYSLSAPSPKLQGLGSRGQGGAFRSPFEEHSAVGWLWVCTFSRAHLGRGFQGRFRLSRSEVRTEALPLCKVPGVVSASLPSSQF